MGSHVVISSWGFLLSNLLQKNPLYSEGLFIFLGFFLKTNKKTPMLLEIEFSDTEKKI